MAENKIYSERLGAISDAQFAAVAERLKLGRFISATPTTAGLFGQNVFLTTTEGEFVLRGAPHWVKGANDKAYRREDRWQFTKERWFAQQLHEKTRAPVPWPMLHDETGDFFGWPYLIMPKMPGRCFGERDILTSLPAADRHSVAVAMGTMLAEMQTLTSPFAGDFDIDTIELTAFAEGDTRRLIAEMRDQAAQAQTNGAMTAADIDWIDATCRRALAAGERPNTFVHGDYKLNNLTVAEQHDRWRVTGLFDLHEARFGDGAIDLVRQGCSYFDTEPSLARVFVESYRERSINSPPHKELVPLYVISERLKIWAFFTRPDARAAWSVGKAFRDWAGRYVDAMLDIL